MFWRTRGQVVGGSWNGKANKQKMADLVESGREPGLLAYVDGQPVGWVSVAPLDEFPRILRSSTIGPVDDRPAWSINCFYVHGAAKRQGVARALLRAAIDHARAHGATLVEGYPVGRDVALVDAYTGFPEMFEAEGFREVASRSPRRSIVRRALRPGAAKRQAAKRGAAARGQ
jgi:GNAT superfamily N-acetyltransferase